MSVDRADDPLGECFIDVMRSGIETQVSYRPLAGFGLFSTSDAFGQRPDVLITDTNAAVKHVLGDIAAVASGNGSKAKPEGKAKPKTDGIRLA